MQKQSSSNIVTEILWTLALVIGTIIARCHCLWTEGLKLWTLYQTQICPLIWTTDDTGNVLTVKMINCGTCQKKVMLINLLKSYNLFAVS